MNLIGESINVMSKTLGPALKARDPKPIQKMAVAQAERGMDYLDLNVGPARKAGPEMLAWVVRTVQEAVDLPLLLDTTNVEAIEAGLKVCKKPAVINSISCRPERMEALFPIARRFDASFVGLLLGVDGVPRDGAERGALAAEMMGKAAEAEIPMDHILLDPIVLPVSSQQDQVQGCTEFMMMLGELAPDCRSTCGLSNVSNGTPDELRDIINRTYLTMLMKFGLNSAIVNAFDKDMVDIVRGRRDDLVQVVHRAMDGEAVEPRTEEETDYLKTTKMLMGESLYSHSWLKL